MKKEYKLEELLKDCTPENKPEVIDWGEDVGLEKIWSVSDEEYAKILKERQSE